MENKIEYGKNARKNIMRGIDKLADAVVSTLGPNGRNVVIFKGVAEPPQSETVSAPDSISRFIIGACSSGLERVI